VLKEAYARGGMQGYWRAELRLAQKRYEEQLASAEREMPRRYVSPYLLAELQARLGNREAALDLLDACFRNHDERLLWLKAEALLPNSGWTSVRREPRFDDMMRRLGLGPVGDPS